MDELARQPKHGPHYGQLLHILNEMQNHQASWPFQKPVSQDEVPDYYNVITEPMDLETMEKRLEEDAYGSPEDFVRDAKLIFTNCRRYNNESTSYWKNANKLEKFMNSKLKEIPEWSVRDPHTNRIDSKMGISVPSFFFFLLFFFLHNLPSLFLPPSTLPHFHTSDGVWWRWRWSLHVIRHSDWEQKERKKLRAIRGELWLTK